MGNEYLEIGKVEGKKYQVIYIRDGEEEWNKGFDDIEEAIKIAKETLEITKEGGVEICDVKTQKDVFMYDFNTGKVRETDMRETVKVKEHMKFTYVRKGEPFENERVKAHVGNIIEMLSDVKRGNLRKGMKGKIIAITNSKKKGDNLQDFSDWFYKVEIEGRDYWIMAGGTWEVIPKEELTSEMLGKLFG